MESIRVKDLMVPVKEYVTISATATLYDAVIKLEQAQRDYEQKKCPHRALLVLGASGEVIGRMNKIDVIRSLEPKYVELGDLRKVSGFGLAPEFMKAMMDKFELWETPLNDLCRKSADVKVGDLVATPLEGEIIDSEDTLNKAVHQIIVGHNQSLIVKSGGKIVGILRLTDVFDEIAKRMRLCKIQ
jgi:CBS domain-containing protein